ncbi:MAG: hypothetical protein JW725_03990 [Candidatus Babeliaceae bacterium]|nr:hypothetical protein [Candidatus Babeliaceae bacterium]
MKSRRMFICFLGILFPVFLAGMMAKKIEERFFPQKLPYGYYPLWGMPLVDSNCFSREKRKIDYEAIYSDIDIRCLPFFYHINLLKPYLSEKFVLHFDMLKWYNLFYALCDGDLDIEMLKKDVVWNVLRHAAPRVLADLCFIRGLTLPWKIRGKDKRLSLASVLPVCVAFRQKEKYNILWGYYTIGFFHEHELLPFVFRNAIEREHGFEKKGELAKAVTFLEKFFNRFKKKVKKEVHKEILGWMQDDFKPETEENGYNIYPYKVEKKFLGGELEVGGTVSFQNKIVFIKTILPSKKECEEFKHLGGWVTPSRKPERQQPPPMRVVHKD